MYTDRIVYVARSVQSEEAETPDSLRSVPDQELVSVVCEDCCHRFEAEDPDKCEVCGSEELAED